MVFSSVDLPEPLKPIRPTVSPAWTVRSTSSRARKVSASFLRCRAENTSSLSEWSWRSENCLVTCSMRTISRSVGTAAESGTASIVGLIARLLSQFLGEAPLGALERDGAGRDAAPGQPQDGPPQAEGLPRRDQRRVGGDGVDNGRGEAPEGDVEQLGDDRQRVQLVQPPP